MAEHIGFDVDAIEVHFIDGAVNLTELEDRIRQEIEAIGPVIAIVIDTAAAHFFGKDENSNTEMKAYAQQLRRFNTMPGGPTVIVNSHPVKNAGPDNLTPRGGGAFMNELDGNFTCARSDAVVSMHWQGKFRGVEFEPLSFATKNVTAERLKDSNGRPIRTVLAEQLSEADVAERAERATKAENAILIFMHKAEAPPSVADIAKHMVFLDTKGQPQKSKTHRILEKLRRADLVKNERGESYTLTDKGKKVAQEASKPQPDRPAETSAEARNGGGIDLNDAPRQRFWWDND
jgi:DNA-binding PadR family transcriptional regulator